MRTINYKEEVMDQETVIVEKPVGLIALGNVMLKAAAATLGVLGVIALTDVINNHLGNTSSDAKTEQ
jgi:hypothetical protein